MFSDWFHLEVQKWVLMHMCFFFIHFSKPAPHFYRLFLFDGELFQRCVSYPMLCPFSLTLEYPVQQSYLQTDSLIWTVALCQWILLMSCRGLWPALSCVKSSFRASLILTVNLCSSLIKLKRMSTSLFSIFQPVSLINSVKLKQKCG